MIYIGDWVAKRLKVSFTILLCCRFESQQVKKSPISNKSAYTEIQPLPFIQSAAMMQLTSVAENLSKASNATTTTTYEGLNLGNDEKNHDPSNLLSPGFNPCLLFMSYIYQHP